MRALNSHLLLIDLHSSLQSPTQVPCSTFSYLKSSKLPASFVVPFRRTRRARTGTISSSSAVPVPSIRSPEARRPRDRQSPGNGQTPLTWNNSVSASSSRLEEVSELEMFLDLVPLRMRNDLLVHPDVQQLIEVVMDLGRKPLARFPSGDWMISEQTVKLEDLDHAISKVGEFSDDNRSGINSSLHRISAIRNRKGQIIGLTCRVGRAIVGSAEIIRDLIEGGNSILVVGPPGVGKTTLIREIARMLADERKKRVVIVDTSNEIGGDGDVPHSGIGFARRMQVPNVDMQHNVMIEAVENHMPETIIIDEIGTELEAMAASTIAQRGVQLVATAHGMTIDNIIKNPSLQILVGGIESVTLGDEEARKRKVQKTILERKGPPTFSCAVELISKTECRVHHRLDATVDTILAGKTPLFEIRYMDAEASVSSESISSPSSEENHIEKPDLSSREVKRPETESESESETETETETGTEHYVYNVEKSDNQSMPVYVYTYKILEIDVVQVASVMGLEDIAVTDDIEAADAILVCSSELKQNPWIRRVSKFHQVPVFVIKSNTMAQMVKALRMILGMDSFSTTKELPLKRSSLDIEIEDDTPPKRKPSLEEIDALEEVRLAIEYIVIPGGEAVELLPRRSDIVARQLELVESYQLAVEYSGTEVNPRLHILPQKLPNKTSKTENRPRLLSNDGGNVLGRLPFLP